MKLIDLQEGRDAPLYHGTTIYQFLSIYRDDVLRGGNTPDSMGHIKSVRVSRDWHVAAQIGQDMDVSGAVIVLDHVIDEWPNGETNKYLHGWDINTATAVSDKIRNDPKVVRFGGVYL